MLLQHSVPSKWRLELHNWFETHSLHNLPRQESLHSIPL